MKSRSIVPVIVGRGMAGKAILKSLSIISQADQELQLVQAHQVTRGDPLKKYVSEGSNSVLFLANPSGLHAKSISEGERAGYKAIAAEKPVCVRPNEIRLLEGTSVPVAVFHGYRVMWGTRTVKAMIDARELGEVFSFESRYWQSSIAQAALHGTAEKRVWKNSPELNGPQDVLTDLGSHVVDTCIYLMGDRPTATRFWVSHVNSPAPHRDTHIHASLSFAGKRHAAASISKTLHGATSNFEYTVVGSKGAATWRYLNPDEVEYGVGNRISIIRRTTGYRVSGSAPFHSLGWLEGYVEIAHQILRQASGLDSLAFPSLNEALTVMDVILNAAIETE